jgi:hypothetical protein
MMPASARVYWGLRAGLSHSSLVYKTDREYRSGSRLGYGAAVLVDIPFYRRFSFRPEAGVTYQGGSFLSGRDEDSDSPLWKHSVGGYFMQHSLNLAFNIPVADVTMTVFGGPSLNIRLADKVKNRPVSDNPVPPSGVRLRSLDYGINSGISVEYVNIFFSIGLFCGTFDRQQEREESESPLYQNNITFSLGYFFR